MHVEKIGLTVGAVFHFEKNSKVIGRPEKPCPHDVDFIVAAVLQKDAEAVDEPGAGGFLADIKAYQVTDGFPVVRIVTGNDLEHPLVVSLELFLRYGAFSRTGGEKNA